MKTIAPKVNIIDYGPELELPNGQIITQDEFVWGASGITYKDIGTVHELIEKKENEEDISETIKKSLIKSAGAGHASMATTPGFWLFLEGDSSKMVDSMFTGAKYASSLMPSSRRVPIAIDQIVVPKGIVEKGDDLAKLYFQASVKNIQAYESLQKRGVPKQEASKIVQYGHRGGGFMFMPLETLIYYAKEAENNPLFPREGKEILSKLEEFIHSHGCGITYEARKAAPRTGCVNPNIFHDRKNIAQELIEQNYENVLFDPVLVSSMNIQSKERDKRIENWLKKREDIFSNPDSIKDYWPNILRELEGIVEDYNNSFSATTLANSPWRVWGEVKRHRTLPQTTESVFSAVNRASKVVKEKGVNFYEEGLLKEMQFAYTPILSMPPSIVERQENLGLWINRFKDSIDVYNKLVDSGVNQSDAVHVIPRGLKMGIMKQHDLYNATTGYLSLRLCSTAEPEMRRTSEAERDLILNSPNTPDSLKQLLTPKCNYVGFCPDMNHCGNIKNVVPGYNNDIHKNTQKLREEGIRAKL